MRKVGKIRSRDKIFFKMFQFQLYIYIFGYVTCDKLIWTSSEGNRFTNKTRKQVSTKTYTNNLYLS